MWEVNTEAVFHWWCRVGWLKLQSSTCRRRRYVHVSLRCHLCGLNLMGMYVCVCVVACSSSCVGSKYRGGFSLLVPCGMIETTIQHLASCQCTGARRRYVHVSLRCHLCGLTPDGNVCMYVPHWHIAGDHEHTWLGGESRVNCSA